MTTLIAVVAGLVIAFLIAAGALVWWAKRSWTTDDKHLAQRMARLPFKKKLRLGLRLLGERRVSWALRGFALILVLYLAMPFDFIPDFIPVVGYLDDLIVVVAGTTLLLRAVNRELLEAHILRLEEDAGLPPLAREIDEKPEEIT